MTATAIVALAVDALSKAWAERELADESIPLGVVDLDLGFNRGVAFGVGADAPTWAVLLVTATVVAILVAVATRMRPAPASGLVVGGGAANLVDRAADGRVTDFLALGWWPTFNVADVAICVGAAWLVLAAWRHPSTGASHTP